VELIPIIKASLGIFTLLTSITFTVSFVVYKIKNRNRAKPYERKPIIFDSRPLLVVQDTSDEKVSKNSISKKFKVLNKNNQTAKIFPIASGRNKKKFMRLAVAENSNHSPRTETPGKSPNEVFNIYNFYSNNDSRPMHKLKVKTLNTE